MSGPTPAQVEALARGMYEREHGKRWVETWPEVRREWLHGAVLCLAAIEAGEVPGVFTATDEQWGVVWPEGDFISCESRTEAEFVALKVGSGARAERRHVGRWEPVGEEQDHD